MATDAEILKAARSLSEAVQAAKDARAAKLKADADVLVAARREADAVKRENEAQGWLLKLSHALKPQVAPPPGPVVVADSPVAAAAPAPTASPHSGPVPTIPSRGARRDKVA